jgi:hypothetical protein
MGEVLLGAFTAVGVDIGPINVHHMMKRKKERRVTNLARIFKVHQLRKNRALGNQLLASRSE